MQQNRALILKFEHVDATAAGRSADGRLGKSSWMREGCWQVKGGQDTLEIIDRLHGSEGEKEEGQFGLNWPSGRNSECAAQIEEI